MKRNQSGFSVIEIAMAVVIVVLIGAVGWLFWDKIASKPADDTTKVSSVQSPKPSSSEVSTKTFNAKSIGLTFDYPSTWTPIDADNYPFKTDSPLDVHKSFVSPDGFKLLFSTLSSTGFGGTGECLPVTGFQNYGESKLANKFVVSMDDGKGGISLHLSTNETEQDQNTKCMYASLIDVSEPIYVDDEPYTTKPYAFTFGTFAEADDYGNVKKVAKPSEKDLKEAVEILKSVRKS